jgi:argininosuccinate lyase
MKRKTTVGIISDEVLAYTAGDDVVLDQALVEADCLGSAAHVTMLSRLPVKPRLFSDQDRKKVIRELAAIVAAHRKGRFKITLADQDVHLAVERTLTEKLGDLGKKIHTGRSRNDQVAVDLRIFSKQHLLLAMGEAATLAGVLLAFGRKHADVPMVGRTHMQPAMPSSLGLWATAWTEGLLDDIALLERAYELNDRSPLGSAASYGVPLPIDRKLVSDLLGFRSPCHNVLYANNSRGKMEGVILGALAQTMITLSRLAQDLMLFTMPEFGYFTLPDAFCTGSSIMPQKKNPDVLELARAKASRVQACAFAVQNLVMGLPSGYNRDLQEAKAPFMEGMESTRATLRILAPLAAGMKPVKEKLLAGFDAGVFATDRALELVGQGMPFRDAYHHVKAHLDELEAMDAAEAIAKKKHLGGTAGLDFGYYERRVRNVEGMIKSEQDRFASAAARLLRS